MKLPRLTERSTIGVIAPAFIPVKERLDKGLIYLEKRGLRIKAGEYLAMEHGYFAGNDDQRAADLNRMYSDPEIEMIICARGGWGGLRLVDRIDYERIRKNPKPLIGYSDITTLQLAIWAVTGVPSLSGPMVAVEMGKGIDPFTEKHFWGQIFSEESSYRLSFDECGGKLLYPGRAEGHLLGGCLSMVTGLLGTPYFPDFSGAVLFLEDVGEKPYKIDRYLAQLAQAGVFKKISGLILGTFDDCQAEPGEISFSLPEIFMDYFGGAGIPVITDFPYGHIPRKVTMPIGSTARIDTDLGTISFTNIFRMET